MEKADRHSLRPYVGNSGPIGELGTSPPRTGMSDPEAKRNFLGEGPVEATTVLF